MESQLNKDAILPNIDKVIKKYRDDTLCSIDEVNRKEQEEKKKRIDFITKKYPRLTNSPILGEVVKSTYSCGFWTIIFILAILCGFTVIKAPYFNRPFTGEHSLKYNTYVETAMYMAERNNPFWVQYRYLSEPVENPEGIQKKFGKLPLLEWGLYLTYKILPGNNIEIKTRIFMHLIGIFIIVFAYMFFQFWLNDALALLIVALMALNPIVSLSTYVTVADSVLIMLMFMSLIYLNKYLKENNYEYLYSASLIYGLGIAVKYSLFLWTSPIALALLIDKEKKLSISFLITFFTRAWPCR
jgi:4-amino-4-deoxy-L-arabinose transferase-like glycosyltransferase